MNQPRHISRLYEFGRAQQAPPRKAIIPMYEWGMERWQPPKPPSSRLTLLIVIWLVVALWWLFSLTS